jgi:site-specific recombinase XerD
MNDRKHLTRPEVDRLLAAAKASRNEARDRCLLLLMFRHGLRVSEAVGLTLADLDLEGRTLYIRRLKRGLCTTHPLRSEEIAALKRWLKVRAAANPETKALFVSARRGALSRKTVWRLVRIYAEAAGLAVAAHPHMLRHACGYALADQGADTRLIQDYLGHRNIQHTVRYTATNPARFEKLWR